MNNSLICTEGTLHFDEEVRTQTVNIIFFKTGQQITINRDRLPAGQTLEENITVQINNAEKMLNQFNLIKMEKIYDNSAFSETLQVIYSFMTGNTPSKRVWQVTYSCLISENETMNFTSMYPDQTSMENEMSRLRYCIQSFTLNKP